MPIALLALPAHEAHAHGASNFLWHNEWLIALLLVTAAGLYVRGALKVVRAGQQWRPGRTYALGYFMVGNIVLAAALLSPLDELSAQLFSAHMIQHELLMLVAAPLLVLGGPLGIWLWSFPITQRRAIANVVRAPVIANTWAFLTAPIVAWSLHAIALWAWHVPGLFAAAQSSETIHALQHACFLFSALLFWNAVLRPHAALRNALPYLLTTMLHMGALGALLTFSTRNWYPAYAYTATQWGLTAIEDQQLGGLIMWIPGGLVYLAASLASTMQLMTREAKTH